MIFMFLLSFVDVPARGTSRKGLLELQERLVAAMPEGWDVARSKNYLIFSFKNARFRNSIGTPASASEDELWERFSWESDFVISLRFTSAVSQKEYDSLMKLREEVEQRRKLEIIADSEIGFDGRHQLGIDEFLESAFPLPMRRLDDFSIWIDVNNRRGRFWTRPSSLIEFEKKVRAQISAVGTAYVVAEQDVPPKFDRAGG